MQRLNDITSANASAPVKELKVKNHRCTSLNRPPDSLQLFSGGIVPVSELKPK
jgi:hypothetical protein